jgi:hypothetical protein
MYIEFRLLLDIVTGFTLENLRILYLDKDYRKFPFLSSWEQL